MRIQSHSFTPSSTLLFAALLLAGTLSAQVGEVSVTGGRATFPAYIGASTEFMYPLHEGRINADSTAWDSVWFGPGVLDAAQPLRLNYLRFPGGIISQYYHFRGETGYGTTPFELECRPGFLHIPNMPEKVQVDGAYPVNMIERYEALADALEPHAPDGIKTLFVANLMSHVFNGDLVPINPALDALIANHAAGLGVLLDQTPNYLNEQTMQEAVAAMLAIFNDDAFDALIQWLLQQPGFVERLTENLEAIAWLADRGRLPVAVELGNENYAHTMLKDDDLSHIPFDCTLPDSLAAPYYPLSFPLRVYMQAILKYGMLAAIYDASVKNFWDIPTGAVVNSTVYRVDAYSLDSFVVSPGFSERARYFELWNRFVGALDFYDAVIPHIYMGSLPDCESFAEHNLDTVLALGRNYMDFYFSDVLPFKMGRIVEETGGKPLWITEWNINTANLFGNTFLHAAHCLRFINEMNAHGEEFGVELLNFHNLGAWNYNQFALIRTELQGGAWTANRQAMYHPFRLMAELHGEGALYADSDLTAWLGTREPELLRSFYTYLSPEGDRLHLIYVNPSGLPLPVPLQDKRFRVELPGQPARELAAGDYSLAFMHAGSMLGTDRGCDGFGSFYDSYNWVEQTGSGGALQMPAYSLGRISLELQAPTALLTPGELRRMNLYPNPANGQVVLEVPAAPAGMTAILTNLAGQALTMHSVQERTIVSTHTLDAGLYLVILKDASNRVVGREKLVIQRSH